MSYEEIKIDKRMLEDRVHALTDILYQAVKQENWDVEFKQSLLKSFNLSMEIKTILEV